MITIVTETRIEAPVLVCFEYARNLRIHAETVWPHTGERIVAPNREQLQGGDTVIFEARHLGVRQRLTVRVVEYDPPHRFVDEMTRGVFRYLRHEHEFEPEIGAGLGATVMRDVLRFESPLGFVGRLMDRMLLERYMRRFLEDRNRELKRRIESETREV